MRNNWRKLGILLLSMPVILVGCAGQQDANENDNNHTNAHTSNVYDKEANIHNLNDPLVIPSENGEKKQTTDEHGGTTHGTGSSVYSLIGSSGLNDGGISSHLESRLSGEGINGVKVFVLDDTVILARGSAEATSNQYDPVQNKVLSSTDGMSGKGEPEGITNIQEVTDDNLDKAQTFMKKVFNDQVQILTVTNPKALELMDKIKTDLKSDSVPYNEVSNDIITLIKMTHQK